MEILILFVKFLFPTKCQYPVNMIWMIINNFTMLQLKLAMKAELHNSLLTIAKLFIILPGD